MVNRIILTSLLGLIWSVFPLLANALVVLQYHHISSATPKATSTSPEQFEQHLDYLKKHKFDVIGLDELAELIRAGEALPDRTVVITFDDGYLSVYQEAYPRLKKHDFPFAVFINTQAHDAENPTFMSWKQMRQMADKGVVFANHTVSHPHLIRRAGNEGVEAWRTRVLDEVRTAEKIIRKRLDQSHRLLAYPFGEYSPELRDLLTDEGYLAFGQQSGPLADIDDPQALPRFPLGGVYGDIEDFALKVQSLPMPLTGVAVFAEDGDRIEAAELPLSVVRPQLVLDVERAEIARQISCFASGQGQIPVRVDGRRVTISARDPLPTGRSRYNCTAPAADKGRYHWYSHMFIRRLENGEWYHE